MSVTLDRLPVTLRKRGIGKSKHYEDIRRGLFPEPVKIGKRAAAYPSDETEILISAQIAGKSNDEIKTIVKILMEQRKNFSLGRGNND